jgi:hypothetical protein
MLLFIVVIFKMMLLPGNEGFMRSSAKHGSALAFWRRSWAEHTFEVDGGKRFGFEREGIFWVLMGDLDKSMNL